MTSVGAFEASAADVWTSLEEQSAPWSGTFAIVYYTGKSTNWLVHIMDRMYSVVYHVYIM